MQIQPIQHIMKLCHLGLSSEQVKVFSDRAINLPLDPPDTAADEKKPVQIFHICSSLLPPRQSQQLSSFESIRLKQTGCILFTISCQLLSTASTWNLDFIPSRLVGETHSCSPPTLSSPLWKLWSSCGSTLSTEEQRWINNNLLSRSCQRALSNGSCLPLVGRGDNRGKSKNVWGPPPLFSYVHNLAQ